MTTLLNGDATYLLIGAGGLLVLLVLLFQFVTRPPKQNSKDMAASHEGNGANPVKILSRTVLDDRRTLVRIRNGNKDHLLLLGDETDLVIETSPTPLRERQGQGIKPQGGIPMPFPPQPAAKLNQRVMAEYQTAAPIPVPDFLQSRAGQPGFAPNPPMAPQANSQAPAQPMPHPVLPHAPQMQAPVMQPPIPQPVSQPNPQPLPPPMPQAPAIVQPGHQPLPPPMPPVAHQDEVTRKLEEALRQPLPPQPAMPQATPPHSEAFEDEIRKLLGRGPMKG
jgi:hypothetical protein